MRRPDAERHEQAPEPFLPLAREKWRGIPKRIRRRTMNKNLYVGNLSQKVTDEDLRNNFSEAGAVASVSVIKDKFSGVSRGFGFVEMETEEGAQEAIKKFNGGDLDGKTITVNEARPKTESSGPRRDDRGGGFRGGRSGSGGGGRGRY
jgi:RNA recognition motif-containing protein